MKNILTAFLLVFSLISCKKNSDSKLEQIENAVQIDSVKKQDSENNTLTTIDSTNQKEKANHLSVANGGSILYLKNGEIKGQARFDTDGDFVLELLKTKTYGKYIDYDNYIINQSGDTTTFFDENGRIGGDWKILKGINITNELQVASFISPKQYNKNEIEIVENSKLIIFSPETKTFNDENSVEAENYFTSMDDWNFYSHELKDYFSKLKIETIYTKKRYLSFEIENDDTIILDSKNDINNYKAQCLLYKKGKRPIITYLILTDDDKDEINSFLKN